MEFIIWLQIIFIFLILIVNLVCVFLPLKYMRKSNTSHIGSSQKLHRVIDLCNSISAGVFLGTCYVQLIPYVEDKFTEVFGLANLKMEYCSVSAQCVIMAGFFLILFVEQIVHACQQSGKGHGHSHTSDHLQLNSLPASSIPNGYEASSDSSESLERERDDPRQKMLKKSDTKPKTAATNGVSFTASGASHDNEANCHGNSGGHGHSHIIDVAKEQSGLRCVLLLAALSCHSLFEGVAVGLQDTVTHLVNLYIGVIIHEALVAFAIGVSLARQSLKRSLVIQLAVVFSLMIPVGMAIGLGLGEIHGTKAEFASVILQAIAAGTFVYVVFLEVLPAEVNATRDKFLRIVFVFVGFVLILCLRLGLKD